MPGRGEVVLDGEFSHAIRIPSGRGVWSSRIGGSTEPYTAIELAKTKQATS